MQPAEIKYVILTGGASRMRFAKEIISQEWELDINTEINKVDNPSLTVSRGVAEVARLDKLTEGKKEIIMAKKREVTTDEYIKTRLVPDFLEEICKTLKTKCNEELCRGKDNSLYDIQDKLKECCKNKVNDVRFVRESLLIAIENNEKFKKIREEVEELVRYYSPLGILSAITSPNKNLKLDEVNLKLKSQLNSVIEKLQEKIGEELNKPGLFKSFLLKVLRLFESKKQRKEREKTECASNKFAGGKHVPTEKEIEELKTEICGIFEAFPKQYSAFIYDYNVKVIIECASQYFDELMLNIDRVRKEITENE